MKKNTKPVSSFGQKKLLITLTVATFFCFSKVSIAQAPALGATASFALFTATGAFTNSGATIITGDIGTNVGILSGFPPGTVNGQIHVADSVSVQAAIDVDVAYTFLNSSTCDTTIGSTLGSSQTLTPKVYCILAATTLSGDLILDAQGDSNAIFIFKVNGMFASSSLSSVTLINLAKHKNIYWQVNGAITLGDSSVFKGTIIANGAINMLNASSLEGRGLSKAGAISITNSLSTLPVKLLSFNAKNNKESTILHWRTSSEINNAYYLIERSIDALNWYSIGKVNGVKNSVTLKEYFFVDKELNRGIRYYRLKQTDFDGKFEYSFIVSANNDNHNSDNLIIYPNPANGQVQLSFKENFNEKYSVKVFNLMGEIIYQSVNAQSIIDVSNFKEGVYTLQLISPSKYITQKLVIQK